MTDHSHRNDGSTNRRSSTTRRLLLQSTAASGLAGCLGDGREDPDAPTTQQSTPTGSVVSGADVLVATDGDTVYAIENGHRIDGDRAVSAGQVIADGDDAGAVLQAVFDTIEPHDHGAGKPMEGGVPGHHIHFGNGLFPWRTQATTGGANGLRITGNWWGTDWSAEAEIESFVDFGHPEVTKGMSPGPQMAYLLAHGNGNADHLVTFGPETRAASMQSMVCFGTNESMLYGKALSDTEDNRSNIDQMWFYNLQCGGAGALAILEDGEHGVPAGMRFVDCFCSAPDTYGMIIRNGSRIIVENFFVDVRTFGAGEPGDGGVLLENPEPEWDSTCEQCTFSRIEIEAPDNREAYPVHIRAPEGATTQNRNHRVIFPRGSYSYKHLKAEAAEPHMVGEIELVGAQVASRKSDAVELINTRDCDISFRNGPADPRALVTIENGKRNTVNGVGRADGHPAEGPWGEAPWEGARVLDTTTDRLFEYVDGGWFSGGQRVDSKS